MKFTTFTRSILAAGLTLGLGAEVLLCQPAFAEDLNEIFKRVNELVAKENYSKALEELTWAKKEIEKLNTGKLGKLLPAEVNGFTGNEAKITNVMGMMNVERTYKNANKVIALSLTGSSGGNEGMGGLAGLARMGMMMEAQEGGSETFRIEGRTSTLKTQNGTTELTVALESGSILKLEGKTGVDGPTLKSFAEAMKIGTIDNYLKGAQ